MRDCCEKCGITPGESGITPLLLALVRVLLVTVIPNVGWGRVSAGLQKAVSVTCTGGNLMKQRCTLAIVALIAGLATTCIASQAAAQSSMSYSAGNQWGTTPGGVSVNGASESAIGHNQNSAVAGAVNAASVGGLVGLQGTSLSITAIGSQTVVSSTIVGQNISSSINATQTSSNSGDVSNTGVITAQ